MSQHHHHYPLLENLLSGYNTLNINAPKKFKMIVAVGEQSAKSDGTYTVNQNDNEFKIDKFGNKI